MLKHGHHDANASDNGDVASAPCGLDLKRSGILPNFEDGSYQS